MNEPCHAAVRFYSSAYRTFCILFYFSRLFVEVVCGHDEWWDPLLISGIFVDYQGKGGMIVRWNQCSRSNAFLFWAPPVLNPTGSDLAGPDFVGNCPDSTLTSNSTQA